MIQFRDNTVKQYVFGLMGDMVKVSGPLISHALPGFIQVAIENMQYNEQQPSTLTVCNNSCWFIGQIASCTDQAGVIGQQFKAISDKIASMFMSPKVCNSIL